MTLKDVVSPFKKEMANFGSPTFQAYVLSIKPMVCFFGYFAK